ncbi:helix-turn-helix domain-containing protein [Steroidobacter agaridevorans]|uniref:helix-turn-helix domain-containing protein n=1 Tax=Steroidobacter agaridevorans TaxID=2695856 RepID=UPI001328E6B9|nr:helix-turn-helix transcriptional regulator [Steroidobacter agaridevorans]GFE85152.1 transcriptional regulator [Steroidobacter agaridevorans]
MGVESVIARRLREARKKKGDSQATLGIRAGIDASVASTRINQYERGKHRPGLKTVERIAKCLSVPAPYFYAESDQLAAWILALELVDPTLRDAVLQSAKEKEEEKAREKEKAKSLEAAK